MYNTFEPIIYESYNIIPVLCVKQQSCLVDMNDTYCKIFTDVENNVYVSNEIYVKCDKKYETTQINKIYDFNTHQKLIKKIVCTYNYVFILTNCCVLYVHKTNDADIHIITSIDTICDPEKIVLYMTNIKNIYTSNGNYVTIDADKNINFYGNESKEYETIFKKHSVDYKNMNIKEIYFYQDYSSREGLFIMDTNHNVHYYHVTNYKAILKNITFFYCNGSNIIIVNDAEEIYTGYHSPVFNEIMKYNVKRPTKSKIMSVFCDGVGCCYYETCDDIFKIKNFSSSKKKNYQFDRHEIIYRVPVKSARKII